MKSFLFILISLLLSTVSYSQGSKVSSPMLRHMVIFKFKDSSSQSEIKKVSETFANLYGQIPQIKHFEWGINNSPENLNQGFTHCFMLTFSSIEDSEIYQKHSAHKAFQEVLKPHMEKVFVVDYWVQ
jgi:hypothetical protein